ncbi:MAG: glycyl-radical enzyme activating protein [Anaerostipes sp.]|nr:glycyl-radical enzyme activating protein [Anaerostipes sp.]MDD5968944.1 glycyl-radical enzyme activating protein [Anaerostipes sp.]
MNISSESGMIFNIQKFSLNDGPGIRTVVFLKGCPLKCRWCANPESQYPKLQILWDREACVGCNTCVSDCPSGAITNVDGNIRIQNAQCQGCHTCIAHCPEDALNAEGESKTVDEILKICLQDKDFYEESGGGVTLSGGEALMQPQFSTALLRTLKEHGIHTAMETTGFASPEVFQSVLPYLDLLLFDMKHWDEKKHKEGTGVSNTQILENLKQAIADGKDVLPRLPVIPDYNHSPADAEGFVRRLKEVGANRIQLLPFHQFGEKKYDMLHKTYAYADVPALHEEDLKEFQQVFLNHGIDAFF